VRVLKHTLIMKRTHYYRCIATLLLCGFLWQGCQSSLRIQDEEPTTTASSGKQVKEPTSSHVVATLTPVAQDTRKRTASELSQPNTEEKKKSPSAVTQELQKFGIADAITSSQDSAATIQQNATQTTKTTRKKEDGESSQAIPADLKRWFQEFAEAVDDEEVLPYLGDVSEAIPRLIEEGKDKSYLTQSMIIAINEVGWQPNCTPLHYAAAKGNVQAVDALLKEPAVVIDAKTEDQYGSTPLHFAAYEGHLGTAKLLVRAYERRKMTTIDAHDNEGASPLQYAAGGPRDGMNRQVATLLVANGADPKQCFGTNISLVDLSAIGGNFAMVEYWIEEIAHTGRFPEDEDKKLIESAMKLAGRQKHTDIATMLQSYYKRMCA
jgi:Ankyrin repeats (3 copies)